ncbi:MAG: hypothetical protein ABIK92_03050 [Pseudomonadota bacterium]
MGYFRRYTKAKKEMYILNCPYCEKQASSFFKMYFCGYFPGKQPNKCINCSKPIKHNLNGYMQCGVIFLISLIIVFHFLDPILPLFNNNPDITTIVIEVPTIDFIGFAEWVIEAAIVILILFISFEIPARYFGVRAYKKR